MSRIILWYSCWISMLNLLLFPRRRYCVWEKEDICKCKFVSKFILHANSVWKFETKVNVQYLGMVICGCGQKGGFTMAHHGQKVKMGISKICFTSYTWFVEDQLIISTISFKTGLMMLDDACLMIDKRTNNAISRVVYNWKC